MSSTAITDDPQIRERFSELKPALTAQAAVIEADRCLNCFDAPCTAACPTHIDVPGFIKRIASGNLRGSAVRILDANILGASCARVCPVDVLCEGACVMHGRIASRSRLRCCSGTRWMRSGRRAKLPAGEVGWSARSCAWPASAEGRHRWRARRSCAGRAPRPR